MIDFDQRELALMIAVGGSRPLDPLVRYLQEKNAAGVVTVEGGVVYALALSKTAELLMKFFAPRYTPLFTNPDFSTLLIALRKTNSPSAGGGGGVGGAQPATHADKFTSTFATLPSSAPVGSGGGSMVLPPPPQPMLMAVKRENGGEGVKVECDRE